MFFVASTASTAIAIFGGIQTFFLYLGAAFLPLILFAIALIPNWVFGLPFVTFGAWYAAINQWVPLTEALSYLSSLLVMYFACLAVRFTFRLIGLIFQAMLVASAAIQAGTTIWSAVSSVVLAGAAAVI